MNGHARFQPTWSFALPWYVRFQESVYVCKMAGMGAKPPFNWAGPSAKPGEPSGGHSPR
jgi:hypothetical protein